ncbi:hypothetical protein HPULCUR_012023 [Helicostylum pulchrum]|uniref:Biogenesis of lysosome-related organelles complex 1 subunit 4 n=1 Tax=Helicostylum pulchrum TaxID=562976 RepID=A0ABP9YHR0_9FUNG
MESLVKEASKELESRLSIDTVTSNTIQTETELINEMLSSLKEKHQELESTFKNIDQLEILVNKVKDTYNAVAENVDYIEKAVSASTRQGKRSDIPVQPYFPPPRPVEIYNSKELCTLLDL